MWKCPKCKSTALNVVAEVLCQLHQVGDNFETDPGDHHEWGSESPMRCRGCGYASRARDFEESQHVPA